MSTYPAYSSPSESVEILPNDSSCMTSNGSEITNCAKSVIYSYLYTKEEPDTGGGTGGGGFGFRLGAITNESTAAKTISVQVNPAEINYSDSTLCSSSIPEAASSEETKIQLLSQLPESPSVLMSTLRYSSTSRDSTAVIRNTTNNALASTPTACTRSDGTMHYIALFPPVLDKDDLTPLATQLVPDQVIEATCDGSETYEQCYEKARLTYNTSRCNGGEAGSCGNTTMTASESLNTQLTVAKGFCLKAPCTEATTKFNQNHIIINSEIPPSSIQLTLSSDGVVNLTNRTLSITGSSKDTFDVTAASGCNIKLDKDSSCTLTIPYNAPNTIPHAGISALIELKSELGQLIASATVISNERAASEASRRIPDMINSISILALSAGAETTIQWTQLGYQAQSYGQIVAFECTEASINNQTCGDSYRTLTVASEVMAGTVDASPAQSWKYKDKKAKQYSFSWNYTPAKSGTTVFRFYNKSGVDKDAGNAGLSSLIPGGLTGAGTQFEHFDQVGRRISATVQ